MKRCFLLGRKAMTNIDSILKSRDITLLTKVCLVKAWSVKLSTSHVQMWELDHKENWALKNWCFWTVVLEKTLESPLDCKGRSNQSILKEINLRYSLEGLILKLKLQYFGYPDVNSWLIRKDPDSGKDWRQGEYGAKEDKMVGWHHQLKWTSLSPGQRRTGRPGMLQSVLRRVGHNWATEQE